MGSSNAILRNSIFSSTGLGIDLVDDGVTANDVGDGDAGANKSSPTHTLPDWLQLARPSTRPQTSPSHEHHLCRLEALPSLRTLLKRNTSF